MTIKIIKDLGMHYKDEAKKRKFRFHLVRCECGTEWETYQAKRIHSCKPCGSKIAGKARSSHGESYSRLYGIHKYILQRCYNPNHRSYDLYGGKGVTMCEEWREDFTKFRDWALANGYSDDLDLDKDELCEKLNITPKIYSPKTCTWMPKEENSKSNLRVTPAQEEEMITMYLANTSLAVIARTYKFTWNGIKAILQRHNVYKTGKK